MTTATDCNLASHKLVPSIAADLPGTDGAMFTYLAAAAGGLPGRVVCGSESIAQVASEARTLGARRQSEVGVLVSIGGGSAPDLPNMKPLPEEELMIMTQVSSHGLHHVTAIATDPQSQSGPDLFTEAWQAFTDISKSDDIP